MISLEGREMQHVDYTCEIDLKQSTSEILLGYRKGERTFSYTFPKALGHEYAANNQKMICKECGWQAIDINTCRISVDHAGYSGAALRPATPVITEDGRKLTLIGSSLSGDYRRTFTNNVEIGMATVEIRPIVYYVNRMEPRGSIIGSKTLEFQILPYPAENLKKSKAGFDHMTLSWEPSASAGKDYVITYKVYMKKRDTFEVSLFISNRYQSFVQM